MPDSNSPSEKVAGTLRVPSPANDPAASDDPVAAEISAEIADHLAAAAEELESQGFDRAHAQEKSQAQFGDPAAISRRCYWIKQGDTLMFRWALILLLIALSIGLGITAVGSWRSQQQMAEQMAVLTEQLKTLAESQNNVRHSSLVQTEQKSPEITGQLFVGLPDKPSAHTEVLICQASNGEIVRRVKSDEAGGFRSGPLSAGDYCLVAKGVSGPFGREFAVQTAPLPVYPGAPAASVRLDTSFRTGNFDVVLSNPLPRIEVPGKYTLDSRLYLAASSGVAQRTRWIMERPMPDRWPIFIERPETSPKGPPGYAWPRSGIFTSAELGASDLEFPGGDGDLPAGPCRFVATVYADILPDGFKLVAETSERKGFRNSPDNEIAGWMSPTWVMQRPKGQLWLNKLNAGDGRTRFGNSLPGFRSPTFADSPFVAQVELAKGVRTHLRVEIPADIVTAIQRLVDSAANADEFVRGIRADNPFVRSVPITVLDAEPLQDKKTASPSSGSPE